MSKLLPTASLGTDGAKTLRRVFAFVGDDGPPVWRPARHIGQRQRQSEIVISRDAILALDATG